MSNRELIQCLISGIIGVVLCMPALLYYAGENELLLADLETTQFHVQWNDGIIDDLKDQAVVTELKLKQCKYHTGWRG